MNYTWLISLGILSFLSLNELSEANPLLKYGGRSEMLRRFPHYVTISREVYGGTLNCSGSIIANEWILTGQRCVIVSAFTIHFEMEELGNPRHSFSLRVDNSGVVAYPTGWDDMVLVKLPVLLKFSEKLSSIPYSDWDYGYDTTNNGFAVMPGFNLQQSYNLTYGMYRVLSAKECKAEFGSQYDEYLQICAVNWTTTNPNLHDANHGSGLVQGWPLKSTLIGIYSGRIYNSNKSALIFANVAKYARWIDETIGIYSYGSKSIRPTYPPSTSTKATTSIPAK